MPSQKRSQSCDNDPSQWSNKVLLQARYEILRSCLLELQRKGILDANSSLPHSFADAMHSCEACDSADGRNHPIVSCTASDAAAGSETSVSKLSEIPT